MNIFEFMILIFFIALNLSILSVFLDSILFDTKYIQKRYRKQFDYWFYGIRKRPPDNSAFVIMLSDDDV